MSESETPPTPDGVPIIGHGIEFSRNPIDAMGSWAAHGDLVELSFSGQSMYFVTDPGLIKEILVEKQHKFSIGPAQQETFSGIEDNAMTTATGENWKRLRRASHPAFTRERIASYGDRMAAVAARFVDEWEEGEQFDVPDEMRRMTVQILGETLLNEDLRGRESIITDAADALIDLTNFRRPGQLLPDWIPTPTERRFRRSVQRLDDVVDDIVDERRAQASADDEDVCAILLAAYEAGDLSLREVKQNLVAFLMAGHESPAGALTRAVYVLGDHPDVYDSVQDEYDRVVDGTRLSSESYESLEYTRNVVKETLRLYPPTTGINRQATESVTLGGYELPAGAEFLVPQWVPHRSGRFWEAPETFYPERWTKDTKPPEYAYFPFSGGPRACIGNDFAMQELTLALATMVGCVNLDVTADGPLTFTPSLQLRIATDIHAEVSCR